MDTGPQSEPIYAEPLEDPFERRRREGTPSQPAPLAPERVPVDAP